MDSPQVGGGCRAVHAHVWVYLDQEVDGRTCAELEAHLAECASCRRMVQFDQRFKQLVRRCADPAPISPSTLMTLRARLEASLQQGERPR